MIHVGATAALRRELYEAAGGFDPLLRLGEDTEFGYRLAQAGAVFVPEPGARSWHLGASHVMRQVDDVRRYNRPFLADRMPYPRWLRKTGGAGAVPLVEVVTEVGDEPVERVRAAVDAVLRGDEQDVRVALVGPWDKLHDDRVKVLADPLLDLRLTAEAYRTDPRVRLVTEAPTDAFPAAYLLELPVTHGLSRQALSRMIDLADREQVGVVRVEVAGRATVLWRTAARGRARWVDGGRRRRRSPRCTAAATSIPPRSASSTSAPSRRPSSPAASVTWATPACAPANGCRRASRSPGYGRWAGRPWWSRR